MRSLEKRIEALEKRFNSIKQEKPLEPIGVMLGCSPDALIGWFDFLLHSGSKWHTLSFQEKFDVVYQSCYQPGLKLSRYPGIEVEILDALIETIRAEKRVRKLVGENDAPYFSGEAFDRAWEEEEGKIRDRLEMLSRYRT
ncbi:MAG TPA: hypothetical protein VHT73_13570 [Thermodesulfobacteriota bacterium]|nr:hypothetical protein [Thermodesulfobacteriota bacterium]